MANSSAVHPTNSKLMTPSNVLVLFCISATTSLPLQSTPPYSFCFAIFICNLAYRVSWNILPNSPEGGEWLGGPGELRRNLAGGLELRRWRRGCGGLADDGGYQGSQGSTEGFSKTLELKGRLLFPEELGIFKCRSISITDQLPPILPPYSLPFSLSLSLAPSFIVN